MQAHGSFTPYEDEFPVHTNPGGSGPFGVLHLSEDLYLSVYTDEDADRIVRAAMRIKAMRAAIGRPHAHAPGAGLHGSHCTVCGMLKDADDHAAQPQGEHPYPDMVAAMCDATLSLRHGGELKCVLSDGHFGGHRALNGKRRWHGTGDDARNEDGEPLPPQQHDVSPMQQYDRQAHLAWHERTHPDAPNWPRQPLTDDEARAAIAEYEGNANRPCACSHLPAQHSNIKDGECLEEFCACQMYAPYEPDGSRM